MTARMPWPALALAVQSRGARAARARRATLVVVALSGALLLAGCQATVQPRDNQTSQASPIPQGSTVSTSDFSTLDAAGIDRIRTGLSARLDMSSGSLLKSAVRVANSSYGPEINTRDTGKIALSITAPRGTVDASTDRIRFNTTDARTDFSEVTYFLTAGSKEELFGLVREGVEKYGISSAEAERWISHVSGDEAGSSDFALSPGTKTGLPITYDLRFDSSKDTQVIIVHVGPAE